MLNKKLRIINGNFDLVDETGSVYIYGLLSEKGGEKKMFQELVAAKGIKEGYPLPSSAIVASTTARLK